MESWSCNQARDFGKLVYIALANMFYCNSSSFHLQEIIVAYTNTSQGSVKSAQYMTVTCFCATGRVVDSQEEHQCTGVWPDITSMGGGRLGLAELLATKICTLALTVRLFSKPFHVLKICMVFHRDWGPYAHWGQSTIGYHKNVFFFWFHVRIPPRESWIFPMKRWKLLFQIGEKTLISLFHSEILFSHLFMRFPCVFYFQLFFARVFRVLSTLNENFLCNYSFSNVLSQIIDSQSVVL